MGMFEQNQSLQGFDNLQKELSRQRAEAQRNAVNQGLLGLGGLSGLLGLPKIHNYDKGVAVDLVSPILSKPDNCIVFEKRYETFREELQAETDEWLKDVI